MSNTMEMFKHLRNFWNRISSPIYSYVKTEGDEGVYVKDDFRIYEHCKGQWGDNIEFLGFEKGQREQKVHGFKPKVTWQNGTPIFKDERPEKGDILKVKMESGIITIWVFTDVEYETNPPDMFFGDVIFGGYKEQLDELKRKRDELRES